jgi:transcriptional regulator with XRE-family HTH domain
MAVNNARCARGTGLGDMLREQAVCPVEHSCVTANGLRATLMAVSDEDERRDRLVRGGRWLRAQREARGLKSTEFAALIGVHPSQVTGYEYGRVGIEDARAERIAEALQLPILEVRRQLGLWVPGPDPYEGDPRPVEEIIRTDPFFTPGERQVLLDLVEQFRRSHEDRKAL